MKNKIDELTREPGVTGFESISVRDLRATDLEGIVKIDSKVSGRSRREYYQKKLNEAMRETGVRISLAAEVDGALAGFIIGRLYYGEFGVVEPVAIVDSIGVDPAFRGRHVGAALLAQLETNLRAIGIETLQTQVDWNHLELIGFLGSHGFAPSPVLCLHKNLSSR